MDNTSTLRPPLASPTAASHDGAPSLGGATTAHHPVGGAPTPQLLPSSAKAGLAAEIEGTDDWTVPPSVLAHPYFVNVGSGSLMDALRELDRRMRENGNYHLITRKPTRPLFGVTVEVGEVGLFDFNGRPVIAIKPGRYWNFSLQHEWEGKVPVTSQCSFRGLTFGQVGQGECMVVQSPSNQIFCVRNGGFAAYGAEGRFKVLAVVDTLDLGAQNAVREAATNEILGWRREVKAQVASPGAPGGQVEVTVASFFNVPANNVLIVQQGDKLIELPAGQHVITNPKTTFRGFLSLAERQKTFETRPAYTVEGVPVILRVNLRYRVAEPLALARSYSDAFMALENPAQSAVNAVVSRLSYTQFMRAKQVGGDVPDTGVVAWLEAFKQECMYELTKQAETYGIVVESFNVLDRRLEGALGVDLEKQAELVLRNQIRATQIELENHIAIETQKGRLKVAEVEAARQRTEADAQYYAESKQTDAHAYAKLELAKAEASNVVLLGEAEAKRIEAVARARAKEIDVVAAAYGKVAGDSLAAPLMMAQIDVERHRAMPQGTVYFASSGNGGSGKASGDAFATGYATALGAGMAAGGGVPAAAVQQQA